MKRTATRKRRSKPRRERVYRSAGYLDRIRHEQQCWVCGCWVEQADPMHGRKSRPYGGGMSQKASDYSCLPGCRECHSTEPENKGHLQEPWDIDVLRRLRDYAMELDPGRDLLWEALEYVQAEVAQMEECRG